MYRKGTTTKVGTVGVYYSRSLGRLCAVAWAVGSDVGLSRYRYVLIYTEDQPSGTFPRNQFDRGWYTRYAGPVWVPLDGSCVIFSATFSLTDDTSRAYAQRAERVFCGVDG